MKIGDTVKVNDGSYSVVLSNGQMKESYGALLKQELYKVVAVNLDLPTLDKHLDERNNAVLCGLDSGNFVFTQSRFCSLVRPSIREVTMAEVCRQFGEEVKIKRL